MNILVPISGGKDSTACLLLALQNNNVVPVFNDTGWEHPITYKYLIYLEQQLKIKIQHTQGRQGIKTLPELIRARGKFPFGRGRFCTTYLKQYALKDWYNDYVYTLNSIWEFWFGMRTQESSQRAKKYCDIKSTDLFPRRYNKKLCATIKVRLPIVNWSTNKVFAFLDSHNIDRNPLYSEGTNDRVDCYPCMLAGKKIQQRMFATPFGKKRLEIIRQLEKDIGQKYEMYDTDQGSCEICKI